MRFAILCRRTRFLAGCCVLVIASTFLYAEAEPQAAWRPKTGDVFELKAQMTQSGMDGKTRVRRMSEYVLELSVARVDESGTAEAQLRITAVKVSGIVDGKSAEFDSKSASDESDAKTPLDFMGGLVGKSIPLAIMRSGAGDLLPAVMNLGVPASPFLSDLIESLEFIFNFPQAGEGKLEKTWKKFITIPLSETFAGAPAAVEERKFEIGRVSKHCGQEVLNVAFSSTLCKGTGAIDGPLGTLGMQEGQQDSGDSTDKKGKPPAPPLGKGKGEYKIAVDGWLTAGDMQRTVTAAAEKRSLRLETSISVQVTKAGNSPE